MSIANEILRLQTAKADLKNSLINKGVAVGDEKIDLYPGFVDSIQVGSILPTLTNPAAVGDILLGKEAINQAGEKITGTKQDIKTDSFLIQSYSYPVANTHRFYFNRAYLLSANIHSAGAISKIGDTYFGIVYDPTTNQFKLVLGNNFFNLTTFQNYVEFTFGSGGSLGTLSGIDSKGSITYSNE